MTGRGRTLQGGKRFVVGVGVKVNHIITGAVGSQLPPRPASGRKSSGSNNGIINLQRASSAHLSSPQFKTAPAQSDSPEVTGVYGPESADPKTAARAQLSVAWSDADPVTSGAGIFPAPKQRPASARPRLQQAPVSFAPLFRVQGSEHGNTLVKKAESLSMCDKDFTPESAHGIVMSQHVMHLAPPPPAPRTHAEGEQDMLRMSHSSLRRGGARAPQALLPPSSAAGGWKSEWVCFVLEHGCKG